MTSDVEGDVHDVRPHTHRPCHQLDAPEHARDLAARDVVDLAVRLVVADETVTTGPKGTSTEQLMRKYTLSADGDTLTVDYYIDRPTISGDSMNLGFAIVSSEESSHT